MRIFRILFWGIAAVVALGVGVAIAARFHDGPFGPFPGGPFQSGELMAQPPVDWSFAKDLQELEFESDGRSRTAWLIVKDGELYVPASIRFPPLKRWHLSALADPRAVVRIAGKRYPRQLERIQDPNLLSSLRELTTAKYGTPPGASSPDDVWFFHLVTPRPR
jgi:hypothetical protein